MWVRDLGKDKTPGIHEEVRALNKVALPLQRPRQTVGAHNLHPRQDRLTKGHINTVTVSRKQAAERLRSGVNQPDGLTFKPVMQDNFTRLDRATGKETQESRWQDNKK